MAPKIAQTQKQTKKAPKIQKPNENSDLILKTHLSIFSKKENLLSPKALLGETSLNIEGRP